MIHKDRISDFSRFLITGLTALKMHFICFYARILSASVSTYLLVFSGHSSLFKHLPGEQLYEYKTNCLHVLFPRIYSDTIYFRRKYRENVVIYIYYM